jgi:hypothetical protein
MSYLQVICEQHRLVEQHLDMFANPPGDAATQSKKVSSSAAAASDSGWLGLHSQLI